jgi:hypothetical protein
MTPSNPRYTNAVGFIALLYQDYVHRPCVTTSMVTIRGAGRLRGSINDMPQHHWPQPWVMAKPLRLFFDSTMHPTDSTVKGTSGLPSRSSSQDTTESILSRSPWGLFNPCNMSAYNHACDRGRVTRCCKGSHSAHRGLRQAPTGLNAYVGSASSSRC